MTFSLNNKTGRIKVIFIFGMLSVCFLSILLISAADSKVLNESKEMAIKRTAQTDTTCDSEGHCVLKSYMGAVNYEYNGEYIPFENYLNVSEENGKIKFETLDGKVCYLSPEYETKDDLSKSSVTEINITKNRGSYYFTTDAKTEVNSMAYNINCENMNINFIDDTLYFDDLKIDFKQAKEKQNISTTYDSKTNKVNFEAVDGRTVDLSFIDPLVEYNFNSTFEGVQMKAFEGGSNDGWVGCDTASGNANWGTALTLNIDTVSEPMIGCMGTLTDISTSSFLDSADVSYGTHSIDDPTDNGGGYIIVATPDEDENDITLINFTTRTLSGDVNDLFIRFFLWNDSGSNWYQCASAYGGSSPEYRHCAVEDTSNFINDSGSIHLGIFGDWDSDPGVSKNIALDYVALEITYDESGDTCTYSSGNWEVDCSDNCSISSSVDLSGNNLTFSNTGIFYVQSTANITNIDKIIKPKGCSIILEQGAKLIT